MPRVKVTMLKRSRLYSSLKRSSSHQRPQGVVALLHVGLLAVHVNLHLSPARPCCVGPCGPRQILGDDCEEVARLGIGVSLDSVVSAVSAQRPLQAIAVGEQYWTADGVGLHLHPPEGRHDVQQVRIERDARKPLRLGLDAVHWPRPI